MTHTSDLLENSCAYHKTAKRRPGNHSKTPLSFYERILTHACFSVKHFFTLNFNTLNYNSQLSHFPLQHIYRGYLQNYMYAVRPDIQGKAYKKACFCMFACTLNEYNFSRSPIRKNVCDILYATAPHRVWKRWQISQNVDKELYVFEKNGRHMHTYKPLKA